MPAIKLVLADVDGTLVTHDKVLTPRAIEAVRTLADADIAFAITSGRPPRGMQMFVEPLRLTTPLAAFNGGRFVRPDLSLVEQHVLSLDVVEPILEVIQSHGLDSWIYRGNDWYVRERHGPHVDREEWTVKFPPTVVRDYAEQMDEVVKIVGISDDLDAVAKCEADIVRQFQRCALQTDDARARLTGHRLCGAFAAVLHRRHPPAGEQRDGRSCAGKDVQDRAE